MSKNHILSTDINLLNRILFIKKISKNVFNFIYTITDEEIKLLCITKKGKVKLIYFKIIV